MLNFSAALLVKRSALDHYDYGSVTKEGEIIGASYLEEVRSMRTTALQAMGNTYAEGVSRSPFQEVGSIVEFDKENLRIHFSLDEVFEAPIDNATYIVEHKMPVVGVSESREQEFFRVSLVQTGFLLALAETQPMFEAAPFVTREAHLKYETSDHKKAILNFGGQFFEVVVKPERFIDYFLEKAFAAFNESHAKDFDHIHGNGFNSLKSYMSAQPLTEEQVYNAMDTTETLMRDKTNG